MSAKIPPPPQFNRTQVVDVTDTGALYHETKMSGLFGSKTPDADKPAMKSKKFVAFLITQVMFFVLLLLMLFTQDVSHLSTNAAFLSVVFCQAFIGSAYIGGQALVDRFVQAARFQNSDRVEKESK